MIGAPVFIARSMTLQILAACASDSEPPKTVKSWLNTKTGRPSIVAVAGDHAVAEDALPSARSRCPVGDERVELDERARVEQQVEALARGQLAPLVLGREARLAAALSAPPRASRSRRAIRSALFDTSWAPPIAWSVARRARRMMRIIGTRPVHHRRRIAPSLPPRHRTLRCIRTRHASDRAGYPQNGAQLGSVWTTGPPVDSPRGSMRGSFPPVTAGRRPLHASEVMPW